MIPRTHVLFKNLEIRDTKEYHSPASDCRGFKQKTFLWHNTLDQPIVYQLRGASNREFTENVVNIGEAITIPSESRDYGVLNDYIPFIRVTVHCTTAPTKGSFSVAVEKL